MTEEEWVRRYADRLEEGKRSWYDLLDRRRWNSLDHDGQREYEALLKKRAEKPEYRAWRGDRFVVIAKATYEKAKLA